MEAQELTDEVRKPKKSLLVLIAAVALLAIIAGGAFWLLRRHKSAAPKPVEIATELIHLEPFVVNLLDDDRTYLRLGLDIAVQREGRREEKGPDPSVAEARDVVITVLTAQRSADLLTSDGKRHLRDELQARLNQQLPHLNVRGVYLTEFLIQR